MSQKIAEVVRESSFNCIAINTTFKIAPWASMLYACDAAWWFHHAQEALKFKGLKVTQSSNVPFKNVLSLRGTGDSGFDDDPRCIRTGKNSAYQALHIAIHAGAKKIILCGVDMHGANWHGDHPKPLRTTKQVGYQMMIELWETIIPELNKRNIEVINCSPESALNVFPKMNLEQALKC